MIKQKKPDEIVEVDEAVTASKSADNDGAQHTKTSLPAGKDSSPGKSRLSKRRQAEILRLAYEGGDELTAAMDAGEKATAKHLRMIHREIDDFVTNCSNKYELDYFAEQWPRDGNIKPILKLVRNPYTDAGTLLWNYWNASVEDYYLFNKFASELEPGFDRDVFTMLRCCEQRIVTSDYLTAVIPFDPTPRISMPERHGEFARQIPPEMFNPVSARKAKRG